MLDLSKLKALELPKKEITVEILGEEQKLEIQAFADDTLLKLSDLKESHAEDFEIKSRNLILKTCTDMNQDDISCLIRMDGNAASEIIKGIFALNDEFNEERHKIRDQAKKNCVVKAEAENTSG